jgi:hypothetical protein
MSWHAPISLLTRILLRIVIHCLQCSFVNNNNTVTSRRVTEPTATRVSCQQHKTLDCNKNCLNNASTPSYNLRLFRHNETVMQLLIKPSYGPSPCYHCMINHNFTFFTPFTPKLLTSARTSLCIPCIPIRRLLFFPAQFLFKKKSKINIRNVIKLTNIVENKKAPVLLEGYG